MKAAVFDRYGAPEVVRVAEVPTPTPKAGEVLVRVRAAAVTVADSRIRGARFPRGFAPFARLAFGVFRPRRAILGSAFSGVVEAIGTQVTDLSPGDEVCGMMGARMGAHAEYLAVPAARAVRKPAQVTHEDAAAMLFGGSTALRFLRDKATVRPGDTALVVGASGAVGTNAVQLAKHFGATVTGVTSTPNTALVAGLGADRVLDYTRTPVADLDERFDIVLDATGTLTPAAARRLLTDRGVALLVAADLWATLRARGNVKTAVATERAEDFAFLLGLMADGHLTAVTDTVGGLAEVAAAHGRVDTGRKVGNLVVRP